MQEIPFNSGEGNQVFLRTDINFLLNESKGNFRIKRIHEIIDGEINIFIELFPEEITQEEEQDVHFHVTVPHKGPSKGQRKVGKKKYQKKKWSYKKPCPPGTDHSVYSLGDLSRNHPNCLKE